MSAIHTGRNVCVYEQCLIYSQISKQSYLGWLLSYVTYRKNICGPFFCLDICLQSLKYEVLYAQVHLDGITLISVCTGNINCLLFQYIFYFLPVAAKAFILMSYV